MKSIKVRGGGQTSGSGLDLIYPTVTDPLYKVSVSKTELTITWQAISVLLRFRNGCHSEKCNSISTVKVLVLVPSAKAQN